MENFVTEWEVKNLVSELSEGREQARQLQILLNAQSSAYETSDFLLHRIISSYNQALSMLQHTPPDHLHHPSPLEDHPLGGSLATAGCPHSDDSDRDVKYQASRKRAAAAARWTKKVKVSPETAIEPQLDDGYGWRKYGQKDILGAIHPRGYYRCSNRYGQDCLATKQVQRSDEDPTIFVITYRKEHTCNPCAGSNPPEDPIPQPNPTQETHKPDFNIQTSIRVIATNENNPFDFLEATSENIFGNYFPLSTLDESSFEELIPNAMQNSEFELNPIVAVMTISDTNTPTFDTSFPA